MGNIEKIVISISEPDNYKVLWIQPQSDNSYKIFYYGDSGWTPLTGGGNQGGNSNIEFKLIKEIQDITTY